MLDFASDNVGLLISRSLGIRSKNARDRAAVEVEAAVQGQGRAVSGI